MIIKFFTNLQRLTSSNKYITFLKLNIFFIVTFFLVHIFHHNYLSNKNILVIILSDIIFSYLINIFLLRNYCKIEIFEIFVSAFSSFLLVIIYSFLFPVMIDRSITVNMLLMMKSAGDAGVYLKDLKINKFQDKVFDKRFREMSRSGVIEIKNNKAKLTTKGRIVSTIFYINKYAFNQ